uniref:hypothetical protein n=1 Tax=Nocardia farcinica TaxID=37329 RepID=UPI002B4B75BC|nr:hypothetical protein [Nocardia farcinica]
MIVASLGGLLLFPQGFLKSIAYGAIATVTMAALTAITILPALLAVLGPRVDGLGPRGLRRIGTAAAVENGIRGRCTNWVLRHPMQVAAPLVIVLILLILPIGNLSFGGFSEKYLPPDNPTRLAQQQIDHHFPLRKSNPLELVFVADESHTGALGALWKEANRAPGLAAPFSVPSRSLTEPDIYRASTVLIDSDDAGPTIEHLCALDRPPGVRMLVGGVPALQKDSIDALLVRMPWMIALVVLVTTVLMFLTFGSLVLPLEAAAMSALGLGSTLGILTWIFIDGHGAGLLIIDATVLRMLLVPATMKLLGDDCWWAPRWMKRLQRRVAL